MSNADEAAANRIQKHFQNGEAKLHAEGAIPLDASLLAGVVKDAVVARMARPVHPTGVVERTFDVWCRSLKGHEAEVATTAQAAYENKCREIGMQVRACGLDPDRDGRFLIDFDKRVLGSVSQGHPAAGSPLVIFTVEWVPHDVGADDAPQEPRKPALVSG